MKPIFAPLLLFCAIFILVPLSATAVTIDTVPVGNTGNVADTTVMNDGTTGYGSVSNAYRIGTYEVTNDQYVEFLNAKATSDPLGLYNSDMGSDARGGIVRSGAPGSFAYAAKTDMGNKPVNFVSWYDAIRFANWLNNGQGTSSTEAGAYTLVGGTSTPSNGLSITRNAGASWFLPSENEWYKAAYYDPRTAAQGGPTGDDNYWFYPTMSDSDPIVAGADSVGDIGNPGTNVANYAMGANWNGQDGNVTTVGSAGPLSESFYGTSDQGGNVWEWNEQPFFGGSARGQRGGSWEFIVDSLQAADRDLKDAGLFESSGLGFRVATVPEPSSLVLAFAGLLGSLLCRGRRKGC